MHITKQQILDNPYQACADYNADPETGTVCDQIFCDLSLKLASYSAYGDRKPPTEAIIADIWDFLTDEKKQIMQDGNHPFYQAWLEVSGE